MDRLRFKDENGKEFPGWHRVSVGKICDIKKGQQLNKLDMDDNTEIPVLNGGISISGYTDHWNRDGETIAISEGGNSCGHISFIKGKFWSGGHNYTLHNYNLDTFFLYNLLKANELRIKRLRVGSGLPNIQKRDLIKYNISIPQAHKEQEKIGGFLSAFDRLIEKQREKVELLKKSKKGYSQQIFNRTLRFKDENGNEFPGWTKLRLDKAIETITDFVAAGSFAGLRENVKYYNEKNYAQLIRTVDIKSKFSNNSFVYVDQKGFDYLHKVNLKEECIILPNIGANIGEVYHIRSSELPLQHNVLGPNAILLRSITCSNTFLYNAFKSSFFQKELVKVVASTGQPKFNKTELRMISMLLPCKEEQIKVSKFLEALDGFFEKESAILNHYETLKKGYLQRLFFSG